MNSLPTAQADFTFTLAHSPEGCWFLRALAWRGRVITGASSAHYAAGWELTLNGTRYTPHLPLAQSLPPVVTTVGDTLHLALPHTLPGLGRLTHHLTFCGDTLTQHLELHNASESTPLVIENCNFAQLKLEPEFLHGLTVIGSDGYTRRDLTEHHFEAGSPLVTLHRPSEDWGLHVLNHAPGTLHRIATSAYLSVGYSNAKTPFQHHLAPGQSWYSDCAAFIAFAGDPTPPLHAYCRRALRPTPPLRPTYCSWEPFGRDIDEAKILTQIDRAAALGFDCFIIDDGWQDHAGDWQPDPVKFPRGLAPVTARLAEHGMSLGLWLSLTTLHTHSAAYAAHADCLVTDEHGRPRLTQVFEGDMAMACLNTRYADHIEARLHDLIERHQLTYLKIDLPTVNDVYFKPAIACHHPDHHHAPGRDYFLKTYRAIQAILTRVKHAHPHILLDVTFELWGGWHQIDHGLLACADLCWLSNLKDAEGAGAYGPAQARHLAAERAHLLPPDHCVIGNLRANGPHPSESLISAFASYPMLLGDLSQLSANTTTELRDLLAWFKTHAAAHDLQHHYAALSESPAHHPSQHAWSGYLRCDAHGNGILALFRNLSVHDTATVPIALPAAIPDDTVFTLTPAPLSQSLSLPLSPSLSPSPSLRATGAALRDGLKLTMPAPHAWYLFALTGN